MTLGAFAYIDTATYWPAPKETAYGGVVFDAPRLVQTKWEDRIEEFTDMRGASLQSKSIVYVMERLEEGGYLCLGDHVTTLVDDPTPLKGAYYIKRQDVIRDLRGLHEEVTCYL